MNIDPVQWLVAALRESAVVERCHTTPHHGAYPLGLHQYNVASLLLVLKPDASVNLIKACLFHDTTERWTGDIPAPMKHRGGGELSKHVNGIEAKLRARLGLDFALTEEERQWLHALDRVELLLWAKEQIAMGNLNAHVFVKSVEAWLCDNPVPEAVTQFMANYQWMRTSNDLPL